MSFTRHIDRYRKDTKRFRGREKQQGYAALGMAL